MVDTLALGASAERRGGSSPLIRTNNFQLTYSTSEFAKTISVRDTASFPQRHSAAPMVLA